MHWKPMPKDRCTLAYVRGLTYRGSNPDPRQPTFILGSEPDHCQRLIDSLPYANTFTSVVINYEFGADVSDDAIRRDIASFRAALLPGLAPEGVDYDDVWFTHTEYPKDPKTRKPDLTQAPRRTAHGILVNVLHTADGVRRLQPYWDRADRTRMDAWQELTCYDQGYASPKDANRRQALSVPTNALPAKVRDMKQALHSDLEHAISTGRVRTEAEALAWIEKQGFTITRRTKRSLSIVHPSQKRPIRLEGWMYDQGGIERATAGAKIAPSVPRIDVEALRKSFDARIEHKRGVFQAQLARARRSAERAAERESAAAAKRDQEARAHAEITAVTGPVVVPPSPQTGAPIPTVPTAPTFNHENDSTSTTERGPAPLSHGDGFVRIIDAIERRARETARRIGGLAQAVAEQENSGWHLSSDGVAKLGQTGDRLGRSVGPIRRAIRQLVHAVVWAAGGLYENVRGVPDIGLGSSAVTRLSELLKRHRPTPRIFSIGEIQEAMRKLKRPEPPEPPKKRRLTEPEI